MIRTASFAFTVVLIWMCFFYRPVFQHPNGSMFTIHGDGIKAYTVYAGHIRNDKSYLEYANMNYPYGQSFIFTDGQFAIANVMKCLSGFSPWFETHSIGIYNLLVLLSFPLCAFFISLIFFRLRVPSWYNVAACFCITIMAPQIFRLGGHLTLTYAFCIPLCWWLMIRFIEDERKLLFTWIIVIINTVWFFIHPYYTIILSLFIFSFLLVWLIAKRFALKNQGRTVVGFISQILLPVLFSQLFIFLTDHHAGRPEQPCGFWENYASFSTVFLPTSQPFASFFRELFEPNQERWEGWSYIGLPMACFALFCVFRMIRYGFNRRIKRIFLPGVPAWLGISAWASILVLLYSMALPFRLNMDFLLEWFPVLHQFRSLGRFAWIFFFIFSVYGFYSVWQTYRFLNGKGLKAAALTLIILVFSIESSEGWFQHKSMASNVTSSPNYFNRDKLTEVQKQLIHAVDSLKSNYQCLIPLPFYHIGSDNFTTTDPDLSITTSMLLSYWCNVPLLSSSTARSPIPEARKILQFFSYPFIKKDIQADLADHRPFLILYTRQDLDIQESYWLSKSKKIWGNGEFELWQLDYDPVFTSTLPEEWNRFDSIKDSLHADQNNWLFTKPGFFYYNSFDSLRADTLRRGNGALRGIKNEYYTIFDKQKSALNPDGDYILSFWYYNEGETRNQYDLVMSETDPETNKTDWTYFFSPVRSKNIDGNWSLIEQKFRISNPNHLISLFFGKNKHSRQLYYCDELMIRPADCDVYRITKKDSSGHATEIIKNNYLFSIN